MSVFNVEISTFESLRKNEYFYIKLRMVKRANTQNLVSLGGIKSPL